MSNTKSCPFCGEQILAIAVKCKHCQTMLDGSTRGEGSLSMPNRVGAYQLFSLIGKGGMGTVYRGRHRSAPMAERQGGDVCIKTMHPQYADDPVFQRRFEREAALGLKLNHPGLVKVHDLVMDADTLALVMEYVKGRSLADVIGTETGPIPWDSAWPMFSQLLDAVGHAHEHGIIHRDLKPENVMVTPNGQLKVLDFGIAKESGSGATRTGAGMGTADYMAPEQHTDAKNVDRRADIYALGMTLYEMLAGCLPWGDELDMLGVLLRKQNGDIPRPTEFYPGIPPAVVAAVMSALSPQRDSRPASVEAFRQVLDGACRTLEAIPTAAPPGPARTVVETAPPPPPVAPPAPRPLEPPAAKSAPTTVVIEPPKPGRSLIWVGMAFAVVVLGVVIYLVQPGADSQPSVGSPDTKEKEEEDAPDAGSAVKGADPAGRAPGTWVTIKAGTFSMGSPTRERCRFKDEIQHQVTLTHTFEVMTTEVTQDQFHSVMGYKPWKFTSCGGTCPVEQVTWYEAAAYANALSAKANLTKCYTCNGNGSTVTCQETSATKGKGIYSCKGYRLPTEAEWEYAYRAGTTTAFYNGGITSCSGKDPNLEKIGWYGKNSNSTTHPVGKKTANAWGLYDMAGNVWEWCHDGYKSDLGATALTDPVFSGSSRVLRGGSWFNDPHPLRAANRNNFTPSYRNFNNGFRCSRTK